MLSPQNSLGSQKQEWAPMYPHFCHYVLRELALLDAPSCHLQNETHTCWRISICVHHRALLGFLETPLSSGQSPTPKMSP
jgi:hypothetical protein